MIYASDLDQTLIYSVRSGVDPNSPLIEPAESVDGDVRSYISIQAMSMLRQIANQMYFVPVTTRTIMEYRRIQLFQDQIKPKYAITSNGGNILLNGIVDSDWNRAIHTSIEDQSASAADIKSIFDRIAHSSWVIRERLCDDLFYSIMINREKLPQDELQQMDKEIKHRGWEMSVQGRKLYLVPSPLTKSNALNHVRKLVGASKVIASGDSLLDRCLLETATYSIAPRHGELFREELRTPGSFPYKFTSQSGVLAAEEILQYALEAGDKMYQSVTP